MRGKSLSLTIRYEHPGAVANIGNGSLHIRVGILLSGEEKNPKPVIRRAFTNSLQFMFEDKITAKQ